MEIIHPKSRIKFNFCYVHRVSVSTHISEKLEILFKKKKRKVQVLLYHKVVKIHQLYVYFIVFEETEITILGISVLMQCRHFFYTHCRCESTWNDETVQFCLQLNIIFFCHFSCESELQMYGRWEFLWCMKGMFSTYYKLSY